METADKSVIEEIAKLALQLPEEQKRRLLALLATWKKDPRGKQREKYTELLYFTSETGKHYGYAKNISSTGVFIETGGGFRIGEHVQLVLVFISAPNPVKLKGMIVRKTMKGIGVQFDSGSQSQIKQLDSIISNHAMVLNQRK
jgi:Tfp pilus assembly protein PilZ